MAQKLHVSALDRVPRQMANKDRQNDSRKKGWGEHIVRPLREVFSDIPKNILQLILLAVVVYLLGISPTGNWIRCNLLDTNACLAQLVVDVPSANMSWGDFQAARRKYKEMEVPSYIPDWLLVRFEVSIENVSFESPGPIKMKITPLLKSQDKHPKIVAYSVWDGADFREENLRQNDKDKAYHVEPFHFVKESGWRTTEKARVNFIVAFPKAKYQNSKKGTPLLFIEIICQYCQANYKMQNVKK